MTPRILAPMTALVLASCGWSNLPTQSSTFFDEPLWDAAGAVATADAVYVRLPQAGAVLRIVPDVDPVRIELGDGRVTGIAAAPGGQQVVAFLERYFCFPDDEREARRVETVEDCAPDDLEVRSEITLIDGTAPSDALSVDGTYNALEFSEDGRFAVAYVDFTQGVDPQGVVSLNGVVVIDLVQNRSELVTVGFGPDRVLFNYDADGNAVAAVVLSENQVANLDLLTSPVELVRFPLTLDPDNERVPSGVALTEDGRYALISVFESSDLYAIDLVNQSINIVDLSGVPSTLAVDREAERTAIVYANRSLVEIMEHRFFEVDPVELDEGMNQVTPIGGEALLWSTGGRKDFYRSRPRDHGPRGVPAAEPADLAARRADQRVRHRADPRRAFGQQHRRRRHLRQQPRHGDHRPVRRRQRALSARGGRSRRRVRSHRHQPERARAPAGRRLPVPLRPVRRVRRGDRAVCAPRGHRQPARRELLDHPRRGAGIGLLPRPGWPHHRGQRLRGPRPARAHVALRGGGPMMTLIVAMSAPTWAQSEAPEAEDKTLVADLRPTGPNRPPRFAVAVERGSLGISDEAFDVFSNRDTLPSWGAKVGFRLDSHLELVGSWARSRRGSNIEVFIPSDTFDDPAQRFVAALTTNQFGAGLRADVTLLDVLLPYVSVQGTVTTGMARLDDDPSRASNPNQLTASGIGAGVLAFAGTELRVPPDSDVQVTLHLELGYGYTSAIALGELGSVQPGGLAARGGLGLRF